MADTPSRWLVKSEPGKYSFQDLVRDGWTVWDGVRNAQAAIWLRSMRVGEAVLFYHSQVGLAVVGLAKVRREAFPDPTDPTGRFVAVELAPIESLPRPVTLGEMRAEPRLADMTIFRQFRLSVTPITAGEWDTLMEMGGVRSAAG